MLKEKPHSLGGQEMTGPGFGDAAQGSRPAQGAALNSTQHLSNLLHNLS